MPASGMTLAVFRFPPVCSRLLRLDCRVGVAAEAPGLVCRQVGGHTYA